jgi:hypothetical protein
LDFGPCNGSKVSIVAFPDLTAEPVAEAARASPLENFSKVTQREFKYMKIATTLFLTIISTLATEPAILRRNI